MNLRIVIPEDIAPSGKEYLKKRGYSLEIGVPTDVNSLRQALAEADGVIVRNASYPKSVFVSSKKLKVIARHGTGTDNIDVNAAEKMGIWVVNGPTANVQTVSEYTIAMILAWSCHLLDADRETRLGNWKWRQMLTRNELSGQTLGLIGFGNIGKRVAFLASALGMKVAAYDIHCESSELANTKLYSELEPVLAQADYLSLHVPSTPLTRGMFDYQMLHRMKPGSVLINCARGDLYVEKDLVAVLEEGYLRGAALDVYPMEPPKNSPLLSMPQVLLSQHNAGLSEESKEKMSLYAAIGVDQVLSGQVPSWPVNHPVCPRART